MMPSVGRRPLARTGTGFLGGEFYSPGISCPVGYVSACSATGTGTQGFQFQCPLLKAETGIGCCPSGFPCAWSKVDNGIAQTCYRVYSTDGFSAAACSSGYRLEKSQDVPYTVLATRPNSETSSESTTVTGADTTNAHVRTVWLVINRTTVNAPLIQLIHKRTDLPASTATATSTDAGTTTDATSSDSNSTSSLSAGAKAGVGIGAAAGGLILIGAIIFLLQRRKRTAQLSPQDRDRLRKLPHIYKAELLGQTVPFEMDASRERVPPVEIGSSR